MDKLRYALNIQLFAQFNGVLNANEIKNVLYNMIISQRVESRNVDGTYSSLVDEARVEGSLYGDQKHYIDTDCLESHAWGNDSEAANLLALDRPPNPKDQKITLDQFRQIRCTVDDYLSKRAFSNEGVFSEYNSVILGWVAVTKKVFESRLYNTFIGSHETSVGRQMISVDLGTGSGHPLYNLSGVEKEQMTAMLVAQALADLLIDLADTTRDFNDYGFLRSNSDESIKVIWNSKYVNKINKLSTPTIFHKEGLVDKLSEHVLPSRYFGVAITSSNISTYSDSTPTTGKPINSSTGAYTPGTNHANGLIRALVEKKVTVSATEYHVFPGDEIPAGATIVASTGDFLPGEVYIEQANVICKIVTELPPIMSAFEVGTSFFNPRSLTTNHYLTWGFNTLAHLEGKPFITVKAV